MIDDIYIYIYIYIYLFRYLTAIGLTPGGSSTSHIYTQNTEKGEFGKCRPCPVIASYTLAFALQLMKKHGKTSVRVAQYKNNEQAQYMNNGLTIHRRKTVTQHRTTKNTEYTTEKIVLYG
jgi:hypothetical protein